MILGRIALYCNGPKERAAIASGSSLLAGAGGVRYLRKIAVVLLALWSFQGTLFAQTSSTTWTDASGTDNNWTTAGNWSNGVPFTTSDVTVPAGPMAPNVDTSPTIKTLTVGGLVQLKDNTTLEVDGGSITLSGLGQLFLASTGAGNATLTVGGSGLSLNGSGSLTMSDQPFKNSITGGGTFTNSLTSNPGIHGAGQIGNNSMTIQNFGTISADGKNALEIVATSLTNQRILESSAGGLLILDKFVCFNSDGSIQGNNGLVELNGTTIEGGTLSTSGGGIIEPEHGLFSAPPTLTDVTNTGQYVIPESTATVLSGTVTNTGTINLNGGLFFTATLTINGSVTLAGSGSIVLSNSAQNVINGTGTVTNQQTIQGAGTINVGTFQNQGTINATGSFNLILQPGAGGVNNTGGNLMASSGSTLNLNGGVVTGGTVSASGGVVSATGGADLSNLTTTSSAAGQFQCHVCTFDSDTNTGTIDVGAGDQPTFKGPWTNQGIFIQSSTATSSPSTVSVSGNVPMSGTGTISMLGPQNMWQGASGTETLTLNSTMQGSANLQSMNVVVGSLGLIQNGTTDPFTFSMSAGNTLSVQGKLSVLAPSGQAPSLIKITGGMFKNFNPTRISNIASTGTLSGGKFFVAGTLQFDNASIVTNASNIMLSGQIIDQNNVNALQNFANNRGTFVLMNPGTFGSIFDTASPFTNTGKLTIQKGRTFTVGGGTPAYNQNLGTTTVDGVLNVSSTGSVNITGGILASNGTIAGNVVTGNPSITGGTFVIGDTVKKAGLVTVTNNYTQLLTGAMDVQIGGTTPGTRYSQVNITGTAALTGTLNIALTNKFIPTIGQTFTVLNASTGITGTFSTVNGTAINANEHFSVSYTSNTVVLKVVSGP